MIINKIYKGHVLDILKKIPDELLHCVITSPPYWGLRDYGLEPILMQDRVVEQMITELKHHGPSINQM